MPLHLVAVTFDAQEPERVARFWAGLFDRDVVDDIRGPRLPGDDTQVGLQFVSGPADKPGPNRLHLHLTSASPDHQQHTVASALRLGASHLDVGQRPDEGHVVLADPEGNEFCVIEAGNSFLDGCGFLGEVACDGTRDVGRFWAEALDWPLVWDQDEETAIQSPRGGTKVAWGGPPVAPHRRARRQRFSLALTDGDPHAELDRLVGLGASRVERRAVSSGVGLDGAVLTDPDGNEFWVRVT
jgi:hypothetical protein